MLTATQLDDLISTTVHYGIVDENKHKYLLANLSKVAATHGIQPEYILYASSLHLTAADKGWLVELPRIQTQYKGIIYTATQKANLDSRFQSMTGILIRNFIDSRYYKLNNLIYRLHAYEHSLGQVVFVNGFYTEATVLGIQDRGFLQTFMQDTLSGDFFTVLYTDTIDCLQKHISRDILKQVLDTFFIL